MYEFGIMAYDVAVIRCIVVALELRRSLHIAKYGNERTSARFCILQYAKHLNSRGKYDIF